MIFFPSRWHKSPASLTPSNICITFSPFRCHCASPHVPLLSLHATFQDNRPHSHRFLASFTQCSQCSTKAQQNGVLNSEFNYSRPSEMLVSRWIKPGSLSKPIFDLKGKQTCFKHFRYSTFASGCTLTILAAVLAKRLCNDPKSRLTPVRRRHRYTSTGRAKLYCGWRLQELNNKTKVDLQFGSKCLKPTQGQQAAPLYFLTLWGEENKELISVLVVGCPQKE